MRQHLASDSSKRPQLAIDDVPPHILGRYIFVPTQKFADVSISKFSSFTYPELLQETANFCRRMRLPLVIKVHPHLEGNARAEQVRLIRLLNGSKGGAVYQSMASINFLMVHALFSVTLNGGTLMDNFYTETPVLTLARSLFQATDAVIRANGIREGLERMAMTRWNQTNRLRQRQVVCWYKQNSLDVMKTTPENIAVLEAHFRSAALGSAAVFFAPLCTTVLNASGNAGKHGV